jgi:hypothetical protein
MQIGHKKLHEFFEDPSDPFALGKSACYLQPENVEHLLLQTNLYPSKREFAVHIYCLIDSIEVYSISDIDTSCFVLFCLFACLFVCLFVCLLALFLHSVLARLKCGDLVDYESVTVDSSSNPVSATVSGIRPVPDGVKRSVMCIAGVYSQGELEHEFADDEFVADQAGAVCVSVQSHQDTVIVSLLPEFSTLQFLLDCCSFCTCFVRQLPMMLQQDRSSIRCRVVLLETKLATSEFRMFQNEISVQVVTNTSKAVTGTTFRQLIPFSCYLGVTIDH